MFGFGLDVLRDPNEHPTRLQTGTFEVSFKQAIEVIVPSSHSTWIDSSPSLSIEAPNTSCPLRIKLLGTRTFTRPDFEGLAINSTLFEKFTFE